MSNVKQQPPKTFTIEQMRKAVSTVESFKDAERAFETTKVMNFIAIRADRLLTQWGELVTAQDRMGFDFYWDEPEDNQPTSVRSAMALAKPYVVSHGNTYKAQRVRRDAEEAKAEEPKAEGPKAEEYQSPFSNHVDFFNTLDDFSKGGEVEDKAKMAFFLKCGFVEKSGLFKKPEITRKGRESLNRFLSYDAAMKSELGADEPKHDEPKHDFDNIYDEHTAYDDPCDPALEVKSLFDSNAHIYNTLLRIIETGGRADPTQRRELMALGLVKHGFFTGTEVTRKGMNWMQKYIAQGDKSKVRSPAPIVTSTQLRRLKSSPDE